MGRSLRDNPTELGPVLAKTPTADVYAWGEGAILKLFRDGVATASAAHETSNASRARAVGLRTPAVLGRVTLDGREGIVFERVEGVTMMEALRHEPGHLNGYGRQLAELHAGIHSQSGEGLIDGHDRIRDAILGGGNLNEVMKAESLQALDQRPRLNSFCHGDFHPGNVILGATGPVLIDWYDAAKGDPAADVAMTVLVVHLVGIPPTLDRTGEGTPRSFRRNFVASYLTRYAQLMPISSERIAAWMRPLAVARLAKLTDHPQRSTLEALIASLPARKSPADVL